MEGSGGVFAGVTYMDDAGELCTGEDYILNRLPLARAEHYRVLYWDRPNGMRQSFACKKAGGSVHG